MRRCMFGERVYDRCRHAIVIFDACVKARYTLEASLSGSFLKALPELVTPLLEEAIDLISEHLSTDAVSAPRKVWPLNSVEART